MAAHTRTPAQRELDLVTEAEMYLRGSTHMAIGEAIGVSYQQVGQDIKKLLLRWQERCNRAIDIMKAEELAKLGTLENTYWDAWFRSIGEAKSTTQEVTEGGLRATKKGRITKEDRVGDPRFLQGVLTCIDKRCKILGIDAPSKHEIGGIGGGAIQIENVRDDILRLAGRTDPRPSTASGEEGEAQAPGGD